jgi:hypothetical protein
MDYLHPPRRLLVAKRLPARDELVLFRLRPAALQAGVTRSRRAAFAFAFDFAFGFAFAVVVAFLRRVRHPFLAAADRELEVRFFALAIVMTPPNDETVN